MIIKETLRGFSLLFLTNVYLYVLATETYFKYPTGNISSNFDFFDGLFDQYRKSVD